MIAAGYYDSIKEVDPKINDEETNFRVDMSMCAIYDWKLMRPGHTVPKTETVSSPVYTREVLFPSSKGLLSISSNGLDVNDPHARFFCCVDPWAVPVCMVDGSVDVGTVLYFNHGEPLWEENHIGIPVQATWYGVHGLDRP